MERDKRGRFVKKAQQGAELLYKGKRFRLKNGVSPTILSTAQSLIDDPSAYEAYLNTNFDVVDDTSPTTSITPQVQNVSTNTTIDSSLISPISGILNNYNSAQYGVVPNVGSLKFPDIQTRDERVKDLQARNFFGRSNDPKSPFYQKQIGYTQNNGKFVDEYGVELNPNELAQNSHLYTRNFPSEGNIQVSNTEPSAGMTFTGKANESGKNNMSRFLNKTKLADFLDWTRAGVGIATNNKIAERALEAEKPFLQDTSESHRSIYGDYRAQKEGERAAAQLRNLASKPLTSDGAIQQQMMLDAQIKGQEYINKGNTQDETLTRQTRETAQQQEKENTQQRYAIAMANRQAMLMSQKNKAQIENSRNSANFSQIISPLLAGAEQRLRNKGKEQEYYQDYYDDAMVTQQVWNEYTEGLTDSQKELAKIFRTQGSQGILNYIDGDTDKENQWLQLKQIMQNEALRRKAALKGVTINPGLGFDIDDPYAKWRPGSFYKKGGTIYKAKLTKRTRDNDRGAKSIESSKKIAAKLLEKAINSLYTYDQVEIIAKPSKSKRKYQAGGGLPFVGHTSVFATSETGAPTKAAKEESNDDLTNKDVLQLLKEIDGLPSDIGIIINQLQNFALYDVDDGISSSSDITSRYVSLIGKIKTAQFNKNEYNNAFNQLKDNGGLNEYAITSDGLLIGTNEEGDFKYFSVEDIKKGNHLDNGYQLLTNSNLLYLRANSPEAAFNHRLTTVAQSGIGMPTIDSLISSAVDKLGTDTQSSEGYISTKSGSLIQGLQEFYKAIEASNGNFDGTVNDLYKYKYLTKSQAEQAKKAMQYIYQTLPTNAKTLLKLKSDGSDSGAIKLIETLISSKISNEQQVDLDLMGGKSHKATNSEKDSSDLKTSLPLNVLKGIGGIDTVINVDRGDGIHMSVRGTQYNLIKTPSGESISDTSLANMLNSSGLQGIVKDLRGIQFGDQKISPEALSNITYNNTGVVKANLPIKPDGSVDLEILERYEMAEKEIDTLQDKSKENIQNIYSKYGISDLLLADGSYNQSKFAPFMITEGYTTDALSGLQTSKFVKEFNGDEDSATALIQKSLAVGSGKNVQVPDVDTFGWYNPADWFGWTDKIYKGVIYIPITNNVNSAVLGANQSIDYDEALVQEEKYQNFEKRSQQRSTGSDILNN